MDGTLLQDWITIGGNDTSTFPQSSHQYLDIGHHEDLTFYLDVRQVTGSGVTMSYDTSPTKDDGSFLPMVGPFTMATGLRVDRALFSTAAVPPARWVRWRGAGTLGGWMVTFRIWLVAYSYVSPDAPPLQCSPCPCR